MALYKNQLYGEFPERLYFSESAGFQPGTNSLGQEISDWEILPVKSIWGRYGFFEKREIWVLGCVAVASIVYVARSMRGLDLSISSLGCDSLRPL